MAMALSCLSQSTAHGLMNIGNTRRLYGRILWLVLTLMTMAGFTFHTSLLYRQLREEKVLVSTFPDSVPFIQPDIVFCSERFLARDFINYPPDEEYEFMANVSRNIQRFNEMYVKERYKNSRLIWDSLNYYELYTAFFQRKHQLFLSIKCNLNDVSLDDLKVELNYLHFACYRLRPPSCNLNSPLDSLIVIFYVYIYGVNITYSRLNVTIQNKTIDNYLFIPKESTDDMEDGIHVYFVQPNEAINEGHTKMTASMNEHTTLKIRSTKYSRISRNESRCEPTSMYGLYYNLLEKDIRDNPLNYSMESVCMKMYYQIILYESVRCYIKIFPIPFNALPNLTFCGDIHGLFYSRDFLSYWSRQDAKMEVIESCKSNISCTCVRYVASVNYNSWPRTSTLRNLFMTDIPRKLKEMNTLNQSAPGLLEAFNDFNRRQSNFNSWKRNFLKVSISPGEFMSTVIEESPAYTYKNFFSDVGGIMGFYMGASLLTLCELFRLMRCTVTKIIRTKEGEVADDLPLSDGAGSNDT